MFQVVVMGVSGCGKSTVSSGIARELGLSMIDGDDLHRPESVAKMRAGVALEDADRWLWLDNISHYLARQDTGHVMACSALKRVYRDRIRRTAATVQFVFLDGNADLIKQRLDLRLGHYMHPALLASQFSTLEKPTVEEPDVITIGINQPVDAVVAEAVAALQATRVRSATARI